MATINDVEPPGNKNSKMIDQYDLKTKNKTSSWNEKEKKIRPDRRRTEDIAMKN
jgi:hypothetical protein